MNHPSDTGFTNPGEIWNKRFDRAEYIFGKAPNEYLASKAGLLSSGQRALLVADGEGRNSVWCAQQGLTVDAFDLSPIAVDKAKALARECGVEVYTAPQLLTLGGRRIFVAHGDNMNIDGQPMLRLLNRIFRSRTLRWLFSWGVHPDWAMRFGHWWSGKSRKRHID